MDAQLLYAAPSHLLGVLSALLVIEREDFGPDIISPRLEGIGQALAPLVEALVMPVLRRGQVRLEPVGA
jgi:hypothetical protein